MLKIAICDDQPRELKIINEYVLEYLDARTLQAEIKKFAHPDELLTATQTESFHLYLLDIVMPMVSGLELGQSIRRISREAQIVYITTEPGYALDAYAVNPLHYLIKPIEKQTLFSALELAFSKVDFGKEITVTVKTKVGLHTLSAVQIAYCEYKKHAVRYTLIGGEQVETITLACSFAEHITPLLHDARFLSPHVSFALNMSRVEKLSREGFYLRDGGFVPVSAKQYASVRNAYLNYRLGGEAK
ncbi:LytTR family two component transcriptional regulator [Ruminiclostridium sufflavum DSM 19573]|uniref:Stage 0 sporulation protein A homolog n=1 Tax=Ruminiclostridium sufflavum DSM 19573 TaxID=1121337 RepID=A0A318XN25_9FIRM|nr:LytTR family DNA-binding domain-containing protein [Ruminiclostridium sufflavum]PYG88239.1 LytTR family two component transcriptional regulator [Ruminiclostridium sufflavum DSM 19573]